MWIDVAVAVDVDVAVAVVAAVAAADRPNRSKQTRNNTRQGNTQ